MEKVKITYNEVKLKQRKDMTSNKNNPYWQKNFQNIYRKFSNPFTYFFVRLGISSNAVSILSFFPIIIGYFFLSTGNYLFMIIGLFFFILYKTLDCSDGEVARIQIPESYERNHKNIEGSFLDSVAHFIEPICLGMGFGVGFFLLYNNKIFITFGVILSIIFTLEYALSELIRSYFRRSIIEKEIKLKDKLIVVHKQLIKKIDEGRSWSKQNIFLRIFGIHPFQGLFYSRELLVPISIFLLMIEYFLSVLINFELSFFGQIFGILSIYLLIVGIVKLIKITSFIIRLKKKKYITNFLNELK